MSIISIVFAFIFLFTNVRVNTFLEKPHRDPDPLFEKINAELVRRMSNAGEAGF